MSKKIELQPFVSKGEPFLAPDGKVYLVPIQLFANQSGGYVLRIGENTLWFNKDGSFDGPEARLTSQDAADEYTEALDLSMGNIGKAPDQAYFQPESRGWTEETASWPKKESP